MGSPAAGLAAGLAATWAAGLAARLEGLAQGLAALGAGLAAGLGFVPSTHKAGTALMGCSFIQSSGFRVHASVGKNICEKPMHHEHPLPTQSQCRTHCHCLLQHHLGDHYQQMSAMTHQNLLQSVRHGMTALTLSLTLKYQSHHYHFPMNLPVPIHRVHSLPTQSQCLMHCPISWRKPSTCSWSR